jgi:phosphoenolpyruvate carboxylase
MSRSAGIRQTIMLGFSDGTKDGGFLQANWSIYTTKETLSAVCDDAWYPGHIL